MSSVAVGPARAAPPAASARGLVRAKLRRILTPLLLAAVVTTPILVPRAGGNVVPPDAFYGIFMVVGVIVLWRARAPLAMPLGASYFLILAGGVLAITQTVEPAEAGLAIVQDAYLFASFVVVANFLVDGTGRTSRLVAIAWAATGVVMGVFVWAVSFGYPDDVLSIAGVPTVDPFGRAEATFRDPNMAGNYLAVSLFVLWASPRPRSWLVKAIATVPIVLGIHATASITALAAVGGGAAAAVALSFLARREAAVAIVMLALAAGVVVATTVPDGVLARSAGISESLGETEAFDESLGRTNVSLTLRAQRWHEAIQLFGSHILLGIGPSTTDEALLARGAPISGEIHNDYIAGFIERGLLGGFGNLLLFTIVALWGLRIAGDGGLKAQGWRPAALFGGVVVVLMSAFSLETLHFRHAWLLFAVIIGLGLDRMLAGGGASSRAAVRRPARRPASPTPRRGV